MGFLDESELEQDTLRDIAETIAIRAGVLMECELCEEVTASGEDVAKACMLGNNLVSSNDPLVAPFSGRRRLLTDTIQAVVEDCGCVCSCSRHWDE